MYTIFLDRNKQYILNENKYITIDYIKANIGDIIKFDKIIFIKNKEKNIIGKPLIDNIELTFEVKNQIKNKKISILKFKRRKNYIRQRGHREKYTVLKLLSLNEIEVK